MRGEGFKTFQNLRGTICAPPDILRTMKSRELQVTAVKTLAVRVKKNTPRAKRTDTRATKIRRLYRGDPVISYSQSALGSLR